MARTFVIGDVHGCLEELKELLDKLGPDADDGLVFLGDLVDRGPFPVETVRFIMELVRSRGHVTVLKGNHEDKLCKWRLREAQRLATGRENKMRTPDPVRRAQWDAFTEDEVQWMRGLPVMVDLADNWMAVHAGFVPGVPFEKQDHDKVMRIRTLYPETMKIGQLTDESGPLEDPPGTVWWTSLWKGPCSVVYGHAVTKSHGFRKGDSATLTQPRTDHMWSESLEMISCLGVDTGCCFGGRLTAVELHRNGASTVVAQAQARREYAVLGER